MDIAFLRARGGVCDRADEGVGPEKSLAVSLTAEIRNLHPNDFGHAFQATQSTPPRQLLLRVRLGQRVSRPAGERRAEGWQWPFLPFARLDLFVSESVS